MSCSVISWIHDEDEDDDDFKLDSLLDFVSFKCYVFVLNIQFKISRKMNKKSEILKEKWLLAKLVVTIDEEETGDSNLPTRQHPLALFAVFRIIVILFFISSLLARQKRPRRLANDGSSTNERCLLENQVGTQAGRQAGRWAKIRDERTATTSSFPLFDTKSIKIVIKLFP